MTEMSFSQEIATRLACAMLTNSDPIRQASLDVVVDAATKMADRIIRNTNENDRKRSAELSQRVPQ